MSSEDATDDNKAGKLKKYSIQDRIFMLKCFIKSNENSYLARKRWIAERPNQPKPSRDTIERLAKRFDRTGSVEDDLDKLRTKKVTVTTPETIIKVRQILDEESGESLRDISARLGMSKSTLHRIKADYMREKKHRDRRPKLSGTLTTEGTTANTTTTSTSSSSSSNSSPAPPDQTVARPTQGSPPAPTLSSPRRTAQCSQAED